MSSYDYLGWFRNSDGSTTYTGQQNAGTFEHSRGWTLAPQQSHESADAYSARINQYNWLTGNNS